MARASSASGSSGGGAVGLSSGDIILRVIPAVGDVFFVAQAVDTARAWVDTKWLSLLDVQFEKFLDVMIRRMSLMDQVTNFSILLWGVDSLDEVEDLKLENGEMDPDKAILTLKDVVEDPVVLDVESFRWYKFRFDHEAVNVRWRLRGLEIWGEVDGERF